MSGPVLDRTPVAATGRIASLRARFDRAGVDALVVTGLSNVRWLSGFSGSAGVLAVGPERAVLVTDGRYRTQAAEQLAASGVADVVEPVIGGAEEQRAAIEACVSAAAAVGLEGDDVTWNAQRRWAERLGGDRLVATSGVVEEGRIVKSDGELAKMATAAAIADAALASVVGGLVPGVTEREFAAALDHAMRMMGAEEPAFETIVAAGPNAAMPHARPSDRPVGAGETVVVDFGATFDGYRSDMTRTFAVGAPLSGELAEVERLVAEAQAAGVAAVAPGATCESVDAACRSMIAARGYGERFEHGTGHGVGLDIHEAPSVGPGATATLVPGTVVTVEPGVYLPNLGGVRIEDTLVVTADGCRALTQYPKEVLP